MVATWPFLSSALVGLAAAAVLGGLIGLQREAAHKPAGFRTHLLVALGSCAFMEVSRLLGDDRIAAGVVTGIGFLGAGSIIRSGLAPVGLTTAASIWTVAAIGLTLGLGSAAAYGLAVATTLLTLGALTFSDDWIDATLRPAIVLNATVVFEPHLIAFDEVAGLFAEAECLVTRTDQLSLERVGDVYVATWLLVMKSRHPERLRRAALAATGKAGIRKIEFNEVAVA